MWTLFDRLGYQRSWNDLYTPDQRLCLEDAQPQDLLDLFMMIVPDLEFARAANTEIGRATA